MYCRRGRHGPAVGGGVGGYRVGHGWTSDLTAAAWGRRGARKEFFRLSAIARLPRTAWRGSGSYMIRPSDCAPTFAGQKLGFIDRA
jgi:hypothetical protein